VLFQEERDTRKRATRKEHVANLAPEGPEVREPILMCETTMYSISAKKMWNSV
jgi:hypothetical protein